MLAVAAHAEVEGVLLLSPPGAGAFMGVPWWRAMMAVLAAGQSGVPFDHVLDCGHDVAAALEAIRAGQRLLVLDHAAAQEDTVRRRAEARNGVCLSARPAAFDLAVPGRLPPDPAGSYAMRSLAAFLSGRRRGGVAVVPPLRGR
ncbi:hypothetical protein [Rhizosaccharibacter radicis]|uniref:Uncharacterized protein n=1 Tax=Rhizosaccharibacter radicis TaxID=2782605 RepID=A0ABT1VX04_9PROT|nr:hypothetical protein [Acetobacteraceae bacterium KSS12]